VIEATLPATLPSTMAAPTTADFRAARGRLPRPVNGSLLRGFGSNNAGLDWVADPGTAFHAVFDGVVTRAGYVRGFGQMVMIQHGSYSTLYARANGLRVVVDQVVKAGDVLGTVGTTGLAEEGAPLRLGDLLAFTGSRATGARIRQQESGLEVGIGVSGHVEPCGLWVTVVEAWSPAERAGLQRDDCLEGIDAASLLGPLSTAVRLTRVREGARTEVAVLRAYPAPPAVQVEAMGEGIWYAHVAQFRDAVAAPLAAALPTRPAPKGLILDLRDNPGGRVEEAANLVDRFVGEGTIVTTRLRGEADTAVHATSARTDWSFPVVVIVNGETASAAEIVAGALQDFKRARLIGSPSWGKGAVLRFFQYEDGSAMKLTVGRYLLPSGRAVADHQGLTPDFLVGDNREGRPLDSRAPIKERLQVDAQLLAAFSDLQSSISHPER